jgi:hypothetical protein
MSLHRWLARLSFSFFIVAFVLFWQEYQLTQINPPASAITQILYTLAAVACLILGLIGTRIRHRPD